MGQWTLVSDNQNSATLFLTATVHAGQPQEIESKRQNRTAITNDSSRLPITSWVRVKHVLHEARTENSKPIIFELPETTRALRLHSTNQRWALSKVSDYWANSVHKKNWKFPLTWWTLANHTGVYMVRRNNTAWQGSPAPLACSQGGAPANSIHSRWA